MEIVCTVECDRCGTSAINDPDKISLFYLGDEVLVAATCPKCQKVAVVTKDIDIGYTIALKGVRVFSFFTGEEITMDDEAS